MDATHSHSPSHSIRLGGLRYELDVTASVNGDYHGSWRCTVCRRGDLSRMRYPDYATARAWARHCVAVHHALVHGD
jgi:hypothetical protein